MTEDLQNTKKRPRRRHHGGCGCGWVLCLVGTLVAFLYLIAIIIAEKANGEDHYLTFMLIYMPQPPLLVPLAAMVLLSLLARARDLMVVNALLLLVGIMALIPPTIARPARTGGKQPVRVVTWNLYEEYLQTAKMRTMLESLQPDVVCLQEARKKAFAGLMPGMQSAHTREVTTLTRGKIVSSREIKLGDYPNYRWGLETIIDLPEGRVRVLNVHFITAFTGKTLRQNRHDVSGFIEHTRKGRNNETAVVLKWLGEPGKNKIVAGDFNTPPNSEIYRRLTAVATNAFEAGWGWGLTYRRERPLVRIDHVFMKDGPRPVRTRSVDGKVSDHRLVVADVVLGEEQ